MGFDNAMSEIIAWDPGDWFDYTDSPNVQWIDFVVIKSKNLIYKLLSTLLSVG